MFEFNENHDAVLFLDLGKKLVTVYNPEKDEFSEVSVSGFFDWCKSLENEFGSVLLIGESAHFGSPRNPRKPSKAQYWVEEELLYFYQILEDGGHKLSLFPQIVTETIRRRKGWVVQDKDKTIKNKRKTVKPFVMINGRKYNPDQADCLAMCIALQDRPVMFKSLQKPKRNGFGCPIRQEGIEMRNEMNIDKNIARSESYLGEDIFSTIYRSKLEILKSQLSDGAKVAFGLDGDVYTRNRTPRPEIKDCQITAVWVALADINGEPRLRESTGEMSGWKFAKGHLFRLHAFHKKGGVARSDIMHHGLKNYISTMLDNKTVKPGGKRPTWKPLEDYSPAEWAAFYELRKQYTGYVKELFMVIRSIMSSEEPWSSEESRQKNLSFSEV